MQCASIAARYDITSKIKTLEESACLIVDLASGLPEHSEWLWDIAEKLTKEVAVLQDHSVHRSAVVPDST